MTAIVLPFGNIVLPLLVWRKKRESALVNDICRGIISFQIMWTVGSALFLIVVQSILMGTEYVMIGRFPPTIVLVYILLLLINVVFVFRAAISFNKDKYHIYDRVPRLL